MRRTTTLAALAALTLVLTACGGDPEPAASSARPRRRHPAVPSASPSESATATDGGLYVALGDSLAAGYQPGGAELRDTAYPALTARRLDTDGAELTVENLGCSGETTTSLLKGGKCEYAEGSQLEQAESLLRKGADVSLVTIDIGGNDLLRCVRGGAEIDTACVTSGVRTVQKNLPSILERLRAAAGEDVPVLVLGYYNPWLAAKALDQPVKGIDTAAKAYTALSAAIEAAAKPRARRSSVSTRPSRRPTRRPRRSTAAPSRRTPHGSAR